MSVPPLRPAVQAPLLDVLEFTLLEVRMNASDAPYCHALADHAHNIPRVLRDGEGLRYYLDVERKCFLDQLEKLGRALPKRLQSCWAALDAARSDQGPERRLALPITTTMEGDGEYFIAKDLEMKCTGTCDLSEMLAGAGSASAGGFRHPVLDELAKGLTKEPGAAQDASVAAFYETLFGNLGELDERVFDEAAKTLTKGTAAAHQAKPTPAAPAPSAAPASPPRAGDGIEVKHADGGEEDSSSDGDDTPMWGGGGQREWQCGGAGGVDLNGMVRYDDMGTAQAALSNGDLRAAQAALDKADAIAARAEAGNDTVPAGRYNITEQVTEGAELSDICVDKPEGLRQLACAAFEASTSLLSERTIDGQREGRAERYMTVAGDEAAVAAAAVRDPKEVWEEMEAAWDAELAATATPAPVDDDDEFDAPPVYQMLPPEQKELLAKLREKISRGLEQDEEDGDYVHMVNPASYRPFQAAATQAPAPAPAASSEPCPTPDAPGMSEVPPQFAHLQAAHDVGAPPMAAQNGASPTPDAPGMSEVPPQFAHLQAHEAAPGSAPKIKHLSSTPVAHRSVNEPSSGALDFKFTAAIGRQGMLEGDAAHAMKAELGKLKAMLDTRGPETAEDRVAETAARLSRANAERERTLVQPATVRMKKQPML